MNVMNKAEMNGLFKGLGVGIIVCATIFYVLVLNLRMEYESSVLSNEALIEEARNLGMVFRSDYKSTVELTDDEIIDAAKALGMVFVED